MAKTKIRKRLPKGWADGEHGERVAALQKLPPRVRTLLAAEWARSVHPIWEARAPEDGRPMAAIVSARRWVIAPHQKNAQAASRAAWAAGVAWAAAGDAGDAKWIWIYATYRHTRGPTGTTYNPVWRTADAVAIARGIYDDVAPDRLPILADALQDAGCDLTKDLARLRGGSDQLLLSEYLVWNTLDLGTMPRTVV